MEPDKSKPEHNPWYLLATLHGEAKSSNDEAHARNRTFWNRFMAAELTEDDRALLFQKGRCSAEELEPFSEEELSEIEKRFAERHRQATGETGTAGAKPPLPNLKQDRIDFSNVMFDRPFQARGFIFPMQTNVDFGPSGFAGPTSGLANFSGATFSGGADFENATFSGGADFENATFSGGAVFSAATFSGRALFWNATFSDWALFWNATFSVGAGFSAAAFSDKTDFERATFSREAVFSAATFSGRVDFMNATFSDVAAFSRAIFSGRADFKNATFSSEAACENATFSGEAVFLGATFSGEADFSAATFSGEAGFQNATFEEDAVFVNAEMRGPTSFEDAQFRFAPPQFFGAKLHEGTVWRGVKWPLSPRYRSQAGGFIDAYERLKLEMDRLKKHEDELDFFALEMQSRRVLHGDWQHVSELRLFRRTIPDSPFEIPEKTITPRPRKLFGRSFTLPPFTIKARTIRLFRPAPGLAIALYGWLSDYGRSYVRPLCWLLATVLVGILPFWWHLSGFWQAVGLSLANTFGVLGFRRELIGPETLTALPGWLKAVAAAQTIAGIVLLFLVGLAIRNRFRMK